MKKLLIDVMIMGGGKFYRQLEYTYNPLFKINPEDVVKFIMEKCPTLKYRNDVVAYMSENNQRVII